MTATRPAATSTPASALTFTLPCPDLGPWRAGNTGTEGVWQFDSGVPGRHVLITALVHGNELCGAWALLGLLQAGVRPQQGVLTLAFCNLAAFDRFDPGNHDASRCVAEDMNRQWSAERLTTTPGAPLTPDLQRAIALRPFVQQADWLLDLHSMHERAAPLLLTGLHPRNVALAQALGNPAHVVVDAGHADGVRMRDFGRFGLPDEQAGDCRSLLIECGFHGDLSSRDVAHDMCARFLATAGALSAADCQRLLPGWRLPDAPQQTQLTVTGAAVAQNERFCFVEPYQGLETIALAGTVIGHHDGPGIGEAVTTPHDDCVLVMPSVRQAQAGVTVVRFARAACRTMPPTLTPDGKTTMTFADNLAQLPPVTHLAELQLLDPAGKVVATIENKPGKAGSLAVYAALAAKHGSIDTAAAEEGLQLFAEHTETARTHPGSHPNIDRLLEIVATGKALAVKLVTA